MLAHVKCIFMTPPPQHHFILFSYYLLCPLLATRRHLRPRVFSRKLFQCSDLPSCLHLAPQQKCILSRFLLFVVFCLNTDILNLQYHIGGLEASCLPDFPTNVIFYRLHAFKGNNPTGWKCRKVRRKKKHSCLTKTRDSFLL